MGYTHYWRRPKDLTNGWDKFVEDVKTVYNHLPQYSDSAGGYYRDKKIIICGADGTGEPKFNNKYISFNGSKKDDLWYESFWLPSYFSVDNKKPDRYNLYFDFCKTGRRPYDLFVCSVLILAKLHFDDFFEVSTDGDFKDWEPVYDFMTSLGYIIPSFLFIPITPLKPLPV